MSLSKVDISLDAASYVIQLHAQCHDTTNTLYHILLFVCLNFTKF